jgi:O-methyltransferase
MTLFQRAFHLAQFIFPAGGNCLEFGVFRGGTYAYQAEQILKHYPAARLVGFDSWKGLPDESEGVWIPERHATGEYAAPKDEVMAKLAALGIAPGDKRFRLVDGFYSDSLTPALRKEVTPISFVNIDVDIYRSTIELLDFIAPELRPGAVLYWDDWKDPRDQHSGAWGEHQAWDDWLPKQPGLAVETIEINAVDQRIMIVTEANGARLESPSMPDIRYHAYELSLNASEGRKPSDFEQFVGLVKRQVRKVPVVSGVARNLRKRLR